MPASGSDILQLRRGTAAAWTAANPVLAQGEPGLETDTVKLKFGDGVTAWNSLAYASGGGTPGASGTNGRDGFIAFPEDGEDGFFIPGRDGTAGAAGTPGTSGAAGAASTVPGPPGEDADEVAFLPGPQGSRGVGAGFRWKFSTNTTDADPGSGFFRANSADLTTATRLMVSETDADGGSTVGFLTESVSNTFWFLRGEKSGVLMAALLLGTTDNGTWRDVIFSSNEAVQAGPFIADEYVYVVATLGGASGNPGTTGATGSQGRPGFDAEPLDEVMFIPGRDGAAGAAGGTGTQTAFTKDLGAANRAGTFDVTGLTGLTTGNSYDVRQSAAQISSKGNARDEAEMDTIICTAYALDTTSLRVLWQAPSVVVGTYAFVSIT